MWVDSDAVWTYFFLIKVYLLGYSIFQTIKSLIFKEISEKRIFRVIVIKISLFSSTYSDGTITLCLQKFLIFEHLFKG